jgi:AcrR family transcriptional regulator
MAQQARSVETRARLLDAAAVVIARHGIEGASVDAISDQAERTSGSLYGQFGSKDALIVALLDKSKDIVAGRIAADVATAADLDGRLAAMWRNFAHPPAEARDWLRLEHELWVWATRPGNDGARRRLRDRYREQYAPVAETLAEWTAEGLIDPLVPPDALATLFAGTLVGLEMTHRLDPAAVDDHAAVIALRSVLHATDGTA